MRRPLKFVKTYIGLMLIIVGLSTGWPLISDYLTIALAGIITLFIYEVLR
ncbi:MAG: hypothetical protein ABDH32_00325 [Candidatus Caldarchaeales archaeon]